jgi:zinc transporter ZupT
VEFDTATYLAIAAATLIGIIHFFGSRISPKESRARYRVISFAAGVSIAYLFLDLLPKTYEAATHLRQWVFVFLLIGFSIVHLSEKWIYQHHDGARLDTELNTVDSVAFFAYNFVVGIALLEKMRENLLEGALFLIPIALHAMLSMASMSNIHRSGRERLAVKIVLSGSALYGVLFGIVVTIPRVVDNILISLIAGVLLYIIVREFLPEKEKGQPAFFIAGLAVFVVLAMFLAG